MKFIIAKMENDKMSLPNDPMILLSYVNTQLRDFYSSLEEFAKTNSIRY